MVKARKGTRKTGGAAAGARKASGAKKAVGAKKKGGRKTSTRATSGRTSGKRPASPKMLDLRPIKAQIRAHVETLTAGNYKDARIQEALASLQRVQAELADHCGTTMTIPLP